jgi:hypothetical protein
MVIVTVVTIFVQVLFFSCNVECIVSGYARWILHVLWRCLILIYLQCCPYRCIKSTSWK